MPFNVSELLSSSWQTLKANNKGQIDFMSLPQLRLFLIKKGYDKNFLASASGLNYAKAAYKFGTTADEFNTVAAHLAKVRKGETSPVYFFTRDKDSVRDRIPGSAAVAEQALSFTRGGDTKPGQRGSGIPSIDEIMGLLGGGGQAEMPALNLPGAPDILSMFKGLKAPGFKGKKIKKLIKSAYAPVIQALQTQLKAGGLQSEQNIADIQGWFKQLQGTAEQGVQRDLEAGQASQATYQNSVTAFINAVGGGASPAAGDIAKLGASGAAGLAAISQAQSNFDNNLATLIGAQEVDALRAEKNRASQEALTIMTQLNQVRGERKADILKAIFEGKQQAYENKLNMLQMMAGLTQQSFENNLRLAQLQFEAQARFAEASNPADLIKSAIDIQYGLLRNQAAAAGSESDPYTQIMQALGIESKQLDILKKQKDLLGGVTSLSFTDRGKIDKQISTFYENVDLTTEGANKFVADVTNTLRIYGLNPWSGEGKQLRLSLLNQYLYLGPKGNPVPGPEGSVWK